MEDPQNQLGILMMHLRMQKVHYSDAWLCSNVVNFNRDVFHLR